MRRERGQALVEAAAALPLCIACAMLLVDCGVVVRDRLAVTQAATRAAEAHLDGGDPAQAARGALPKSLHPSLSTRADDEHVAVEAESRSTVARVAGIPIVHRSRVQLTGMEDER